MRRARCRLRCRHIDERGGGEVVSAPEADAIPYYDSTVSSWGARVICVYICTYAHTSGMHLAMPACMYVCKVDCCLLDLVLLHLDKATRYGWHIRHAVLVASRR